MGLSMVVTCNNCGFTKNIFTGTGMHYPMLFEILNELNKSERRRVEAMIEADTIANYEYYRELYKCPKCDVLTDKCRLMLTLKDGLLPWQGKIKGTEMAIAIEHQESIAIAYVEKAIEGYLHKLPEIHENITENNIENIIEIAYTIIRRQMEVYY